MAVVLVPPLEVDRQPVSSSRVRNELLAGNVAMARTLLGRAFRLTGMVKTGQKPGQTLGFPMANLEEIATPIPGNGVYAGQVHHAGKIWPTAVNVGPNPTFGEDVRKVEAHLIGFHGDLYGQILALDLVEKLPRSSDLCRRAGAETVAPPRRGPHSSTCRLKDISFLPLTTDNPCRSRRRHDVPWQTVRFLRLNNQTGATLTIFVQLTQGGPTYNWTVHSGVTTYLAIDQQKIAAALVGPVG